MLISKNYKIFLAGHSGMVGSAIKRALIKKVIKTYFVLEEKFKFIKFFEVDGFKENKPDIVILAAAKLVVFMQPTFPSRFLRI